MPHFDRSFVAPCLAAALLAFASPAVLAVQVCELNGQPVNPNNGYTTEGKTGLMRCRDGEGGPVVREEELQQGKFMGVVRRFRDSALEREYRVNERGNRDGLSREWAPATGGDKPVLVREETYRNGSTVGLVRTWTAAGQPRRIAFHGDDGNERASVEFNAQGQLSELRCAPQPVFGTAFDDRAACGHAGAATTSTLYSGKGQAASRVMVERGVRRKLETLYESGAVHELQESNATGGVERTFAADGTKRREVQWLALAGDRPRRVTTLDQEFHESGKKLRERHWQAGERGELVSEETWYLNGQPKERVEYSSADGRSQRRETSFHDSGRKSFEGVWFVDSRGGRGSERPTGTHRSFDADGRVRIERSYDERGRINHERELDERGNVVHDDEVFEDGSRKAVGR